MIRHCTASGKTWLPLLLFLAIGLSQEISAQAGQFARRDTAAAYQPTPRWTIIGDEFAATNQIILSFTAPFPAEFTVYLTRKT